MQKDDQSSSSNGGALTVIILNIQAWHFQKWQDKKVRSSNKIILNTDVENTHHQSKRWGMKSFLIGMFQSRGVFIHKVTDNINSFVYGMTVKC